MQDIYILGDSGFAREVAFLIDDINRINYRWNIVGFLTIDDEKIGQNNGKYKIVGRDDDFFNTDKPTNFVIGIGHPETINKIINKFERNANNNLLFPNLIHPNCIGDWERIKIGKGNIICAGNIFTTDIEIGNFNIFNLSCTIGHECNIGDGNVFNPTVNISGGIKLGKFNLIGIGSQLLQFLSVKEHIFVGAGSVVTKNLEEPGVYVGIPAKKIK